MALLDDNSNGSGLVGQAEFSERNGRPDRIVPAIEFHDVSLAFDDQVVLDNVNLTIRRGETKIVLGGSGTGKSTIINLVLGLLKPDAGRIVIDGEDVTDYTEPDML